MDLDYHTLPWSLIFQLFWCVNCHKLFSNFSWILKDQNLLQNGLRLSHFTMVDPVTVLKTFVIVWCSINFARLSNNAVTYLISLEKLPLNQHNEYSGPVCQPLSSLKFWEIASLDKNSHGDFMHEQISSIALTKVIIHKSCM